MHASRYLLRFLWASSLIAGAVAQEDTAVKPSTVVFVCEHGAAKSVIAAEYFNRLAIQNGLPFRAISRGTKPDVTIPAVVKDGLARDGINVAGLVPKPLSNAEATGASTVVLLGVELPAETRALPKKAIEWNDIPSVSESFAPARDVIVKHVKELVDSLAQRPRQ